MLKRFGYRKEGKAASWEKTAKWCAASASIAAAIKVARQRG